MSVRIEVRSQSERAARPKVCYLSSRRHRAAAAWSPAAVHQPVAGVQQALAQRAPKVSRPKDAQQLLLRGSGGLTQRIQGNAFRLHLHRDTVWSIGRHLDPKKAKWHERQDWKKVPGLKEESS